MGARIRAHDWSSTRLGPLQRWPQSLRSALSICLNASLPIAIYWGEDLRLLYNDAWSAFLGERHPWALGRPAAEVWSDILDVVGPQMARVLESGEGFATLDQRLVMARGGAAAETFWNYSFTPIRGEDGNVCGIFNQANETTARVLGERRNQFLLGLSDRLRALSDPRDIVQEAQASIGAFLGANRVGYGEVDETERYVTTTSAWSDGSVPTYEGAHDMATFGEEAWRQHRRGVPVVIPDVETDPRTRSRESLDAFRAVEIRAVIAASLVKAGRLRAALYVSAKEPKTWTEDDGRIVVEVADRTWAAAARARMETALRLSEARLRELNETLERRVAEALAERKLFADIVEGTDALMKVIDPSFTLLACNPAATNEIERAYGVRLRLGENLLEQLRGIRDEQEIQALWARALGGETFSEIHALGGPEGPARHFEMNFSPLRDGQGRTIGAYQFAYDVTDRVRDQQRLAEAELALRQSQKMEAMGQLTGGVAHDFNNLLAPIIGPLDMLQRRGVGGEREQRLIAGALQSAERAKTLVQRLLAFARRQPLQSEPVDVGELVDNMAELLASTIGPQIRVTIEVAPGLPLAEADPNQLEMALLNLSVNARDAMPGGGELRIAVSAEDAGEGHPARLAPGRYIKLSVTDNGVGMDPATLSRAIEPFFSTKGVGKGTGLGLSMVHGLASQLGGALTIHSEPGRGATVELWLPQSDQSREPASESPSAALTGNRGVALVVDDEDLVRMSTAEMLQDLGYEVVEAASAEAALRLVDRGLHFDLLVTDHLMPGMSGTDLAHEIRRHKPDAPVLVVTGYAENEDMDPHLLRLIKPFRKDELAASLAGAN